MEVRKLEACSELTLEDCRLSLISFIGPVVLYIVPDASSAVSMMMFTTVLALE